MIARIKAEAPAHRRYFRVSGHFCKGVDRRLNPHRGERTRFRSTGDLSIIERTLILSLFPEGTWLPGIGGFFWNRQWIKRLKFFPKEYKFHEI
jgi:hypothetical protein